ncbi:hypothetical protein QL285_035207 [Trifolium repens]|nr:hypothetical protein QL285_035207 [Trifolium repens]
MFFNILEHRIIKGVVESVCFFAFNAMISCMLMNIISVSIRNGLMIGWAILGFVVGLLQFRAVINQIRGWGNGFLTATLFKEHRGFSPKKLFKQGCQNQTGSAGRTSQTLNR